MARSMKMRKLLDSFQEIPQEKQAQTEQVQTEQVQAKTDVSEAVRKMAASMREFPRETEQKRTVDRSAAVKEMAVAFQSIPRERAPKPGAKSRFAEKETAATFQDIPREAVQKQQDKQRIKEAIQDMRRLLVLWEKDVFGRSAEADRREFAESRQKWEESIRILRSYLTEKGDI